MALKFVGENPHPYLTQARQIPPELSERDQVVYIHDSIVSFFWGSGPQFLVSEILCPTHYCPVFVILVILCLHISQHFIKIGKFSNFSNFTASCLFEFLRYILGAQDDTMIKHTIFPETTIHSSGLDNQSLRYEPVYGTC